MQRFYGEKRDEYGRAEVGASVSVYDTGTSNLSTIYEASDPLTTPASAIPNPMTTDSNGRYAFAAQTGVYDIVIKGSGSVEYKNKVALFDQTTSSTTGAGGSSTQIQYNTGGVLSGSASLTTDGTNLTVGGYSSVEATRFNTSTPDTSNVVGNTYWDSTNGTLATVLDSTAGVVLQHGQELHVSCVNKTGSIIPNGSAVYVNDAQGNRPTCALAKADSLSTCQVIGVTTQAIAINGTGLVTIAGDVHDFDTSIFSGDGKTLYLSASTAGLITETAPTSPNYLVTIGTNLNTTNNGIIFVNPSRPIALDTTLAADSGLVAPSQKAAKAYTDTLQANLASTASAALGDALVGFKQSNTAGVMTGAVASTVHRKLQERVSVLDFGADPTGVTDSTPAFILAQGAGNVDLIMPPGTYKLTNFYPFFGVSLIGAGKEATYIQQGSSSYPAIYVLADGSTANRQSIIGQRFIDFKIIGTNSALASPGMKVENSGTGAIQHCDFRFSTYQCSTALQILDTAGNKATYNNNFDVVARACAATSFITDGVYNRYKLSTQDAATDAVHDDSYFSTFSQVAVDGPCKFSGTGNTYINPTIEGCPGTPGAGVLYAMWFNGSNLTVISPEVTAFPAAKCDVAYRFVGSAYVINLGVGTDITGNIPTYPVDLSSTPNVTFIGASNGCPNKISAYATSAQLKACTFIGDCSTITTSAIVTAYSATITPVLKFGGGSTGITYSAATGTYQQQGNRIWFNIYINLSNKGSSTGAVTVTGLPVASSASGGIVPVTIDSENVTGATALAGYIAAGATEVTLKYQVTADYFGAITDTAFANTSRLYISGSYPI